MPSITPRRIAAPLHFPLAQKPETRNRLQYQPIQATVEESVNDLDLELELEPSRLFGDAMWLCGEQLRLEIEVILGAKRDEAAQMLIEMAGRPGPDRPYAAELTEFHIVYEILNDLSRRDAGCYAAHVDSLVNQVWCARRSRRNYLLAARAKMAMLEDWSGFGSYQRDWIRSQKLRVAESWAVLQCRWLLYKAVRRENAADAMRMCAEGITGLLRIAHAPA